MKYPKKSKGEKKGGTVGKVTQEYGPTRDTIPGVPPRQMGSFGGGSRDVSHSIKNGKVAKN